MQSKDRFTILTHANGTKTLVDAENAQAMHSRIGPESEARMVYAERAEIEKRLTQEEASIVLYDVGMGTAANVLAVLNRLREAAAAGLPCRGKLEVHSFESKPEGLATALENLSDFPMLSPWRNELVALLEKRAHAFRIGEVRIEWRLHVGDFYRMLGDVPAADVIFFDFYSPKVVPELWTGERFEMLRKHLGEKSCALYTYSAATPVRFNLLLAGFFVGEGISTGMKNETTIAHTRFEGLEKPLTTAWLRKLETSTSLEAAGLGRSDLQARVRNHPQWSGSRND